MEYNKSWTSSAIESFETCVTAHGGWLNWQRFGSVTLKLKRFEGLLPLVKGISLSTQPKTIFVDPKARRVEFNYESHKDIFLDGKLIYSPEGKVVLDGRSLFTKSVFEKWTLQHTLYFFGYAWANYIGYPFILPKFELVGWGHAKNSSWFEISFPENFHTHCKVQKFFFDDQHRLFRHDYHADFAGSIFYGAHFTEGYREFDGLQIACIRKIKPRLGPIVLPIYGIYGELEI